jgi:lipopolysaccharide assembly outer membrane protein LptD (OstA)
MLKVRAIALVLLAGCFPLIAQPFQAQSGWEIECPQGVEFDLNTGLATASNGVVVKYQGARLKAVAATINQLTGEVQAEGDVRIEAQGRLWTSERASYNLRTGELVTERFRLGQPPVLAAGDVAAGNQRLGVFAGVNGMVSADDYAQPSYRVKARKLIVVTGQYVEARQAVLYVGKVPVFYFPHYRRSLKIEAPTFEFTPGYRSAYGPYLLTSYHWHLSETFDGAVNLDVRQKRGLGVGPDLNWHLKKWGEGTGKYYYTHDDDAGRDPSGKLIDDDRQRVWLSHLATPATNLTLRGMLRYQSDPYVIHDFFEGEYKDNVQPSTFAEATKLWSNFGLDVLAQPRVNDFFETVERLPDVKLTGFRQQLGHTPLYYESDSSLGYFRRKFAEGDTNLPYAALRADTYHQIVLPHTFFGWLNVTPRVGGRFTHYGEAHLDGGVTDDENRGVFNTGAEASAKASRLWRGAYSRFFQVNGLRHIVQPSVNYAYVPTPNVTPRHLPQFDYEMASTRLLPIDYPDYNAIDAIDSQNVMRFGLRNKLQTKRKHGLDNLLNWALYMDWRLNPREDQPTFSDFYSDADLKPFSWLTFNSEVRVDISDGRLNEANHSFTITPNTTWSVAFGHRYLDDEPLFGPDSGNNLFYGTFYYRFDENWGFRMTQRFEAEYGLWEEQLYSIYRDFRSWTGALTFRVRRNRGESPDYTVALTFSLKAFPRYHVGNDANRPSSLLGY